MNFTTIGSATNAAKFKALQVKWAERKKNPFLPKENEQKEDPRIAEIKRQAEQQRKANQLGQIEGKLKSGAALSSRDMEYLRKNSPQLYEKAVKIEKEREEYKRALRRCRSKEDVQKLHMRTLSQFSAEAKTISQNPNIPEGKKIEEIEFIGMKMAAVNNEHVTFRQTLRYSALPETNDKARKKKHPEITLEERSKEQEEHIRRLRSRNIFEPTEDGENFEISGEEPPQEFAEQSEPQARLEIPTPAGGTYDAKGAFSSDRSTSGNNDAKPPLIIKA